VGFTAGSPSLASTATGRVVETLIGAAVGILVNVVIAPPLYIQPADDAVGELVSRISEFSRRMAESLRGDWSRSAAHDRLQEARGLGVEVTRADLHLSRTEESALLNPRGKAAREAQPRLRTALTGLEHCYVSLRNLCRAVLDRTYFVAEDDMDGAYRPEARRALADVLDAFADAMDTVDPIATNEPDVAITRALVAKQLEELRERRDRLAELLLVDPAVDAAAWEQHGALLAAVDRLRVEVEAAVRPAEGPWRPEPVHARHLAAVRRVLETMSRRERFALDASEAELVDRTWTADSGPPPRPPHDPPDRPLPHDPPPAGPPPPPAPGGPPPGDTPVPRPARHGQWEK
jgi:hypothetical protein